MAALSGPEARQARLERLHENGFLSTEQLNLLKGSILRMRGVHGGGIVVHLWRVTHTFVHFHAHIRTFSCPAQIQKKSIAQLLDLPLASAEVCAWVLLVPYLSGPTGGACCSRR